MRRLKWENTLTDVRVSRGRKAIMGCTFYTAMSATPTTQKKKNVSLYAKGMSPRDILDGLQDVYGVELSAPSISAITDKVWSLVEAW